MADAVQPKYVRGAPPRCWSASIGPGGWFQSPLVGGSRINQGEAPDQVSMSSHSDSGPGRTFPCPLHGNRRPRPRVYQSMGRFPFRSAHTLIIPSSCCRSLGPRRGDTVWPDALRSGVRSRWHSRTRTMLATVPTSCARSFIVAESEQERPSLHPPSTTSRRLNRRSETTMSNELVETGWKRFLDRLRQLWGKSSGAGAPAAAATTAIAETPARLVSEEPSAPSPGSP